MSTFGRRVAVATCIVAMAALNSGCAAVVVTSAVALGARAGSGTQAVDVDLDLPLPRVVHRDEVSPACLDVTSDAVADAEHFDPADAPPASAMYDMVPPDGGPHFPAWSEIVVDVASAVDTRSVVHNLEHGAIVVWVDVDRVDAGVSAGVEAWARQLNGLGFAAPQVGAGVIVLPMPPDATTEAAVALRGWHAALDCATWDRAVADAFVVNNYGDHGRAPEGHLSPYPQVEDVLRTDTATA